MLSHDNDDSNQKHDSDNLKTSQQGKEASHDRLKENNKSSKVKILSQTLLKAANLTSRKEFLNKVLGDTNSKIDKFLIKSPVTSTNSGNNDVVMEKEGQIPATRQCRVDNVSDESDVSNSNSGQGKFVRDLMKRKQEQGKNEAISSSKDDGKFHARKMYNSNLKSVF